jgi:hypothetical protein
MGEMAHDGINIAHHVRPLLEPHSLPVEFCTFDALPAYEFKGNFRRVFTFLVMIQSMMESAKDPCDSFTSSESMCILMRAARHLIPDAITHHRKSLSNMGNGHATDSADLLEPLQYAFPVALFVISMVRFQIASFMYTREVDRFGSLLLGLPKQNKRDCMKSVRRSYEAQDSTSNGQPISQSGGWNWRNTHN